MDKAPLEGFKIIELGESEAAGMCTLVVSDFGADVFRVSFLREKKESDKCADYRICDRGKNVCRLDLRKNNERERLLELIRSADAIVNGMQSFEMAAARFDESFLKNENPKAVYVALTPYGSTGPCADRLWSEACVQAESGFVSTTGERSGEPVRCGGDIACFAGGMTACAALLMGLYDGLNGNPGRSADVSLMDSLVFGLENQLSLSIKTGKIPGPMGNRYALSAPVGNYICKDGKEIMISVATDSQWENFALATGHKEWLEIPEYMNVAGRIKNVDELSKLVEEAFLEYERSELIERLHRKSCVYGCINTFPEVVSHPQVVARDIFKKVTLPDKSTVTVPVNPVYIHEDKECLAIKSQMDM